MMTNNREIAASIARTAAEIIQEKGKATGTLEDEQGRVCTFGAIRRAERLLGASRHDGNAVIDGMFKHSDIVAYEETGETSAYLVLSSWSDLPTTTEEIIAKAFLQVADEIEVSDG